MMRKIGLLTLALALGCGTAMAQRAMRPNYGDIYCSGNVTTEGVPHDTYLISGEESVQKATFSQGDYVYINRGSADGVKVGDQYAISRPVTDYGKVKWFEWQPQLRRAMGTQWADLGKVRVVSVLDKVSIAEVVFTCAFMERGDYARPFAERPIPVLKMDKFDRFAPVSGKPVGMVVSGKEYRQQVGTMDIIYVNLGTSQGVKEGDYFRFFRYQGTRHDAAYSTWSYQDRMFGFGSTPVRYTWKDLPREILGEGIVLRVSENAATVLITFSLKEVYMGDYVEGK